MRACLEVRMKAQVPNDHDCVPWLVCHAATTINRYKVGLGGTSAYERANGIMSNQQVAELLACWSSVASKFASRCLISITKQCNISPYLVYWSP